MFIDEKNLVTLEYIFYQKDGNYSLIKKKPHNTNLLGTQKLDHEHLNIFNDEPMCFEDTNDDYIHERQNNRCNKKCFINNVNGDTKIEPLICAWKINNSG